MIPFDHFWQKAAFLLVQPRIVHNYAAGGKKDGQFQAQYKGGEYIFCTTEDGSVLRIPKREFRSMYAKWEKYVSGDLSLKWEKESIFTNYTASIIHQYISKFS